MKKKKLKIINFLILILYLLIHFLFIKDASFVLIGLIFIIMNLLFNFRFTGVFTIAGYCIGYIFGYFLDVPSSIGVLPNNLYVIWLFIFIAFISIGVFCDVKFRINLRRGI